MPFFINNFKEPYENILLAFGGFYEFIILIFHRISKSFLISQPAKPTL